MKGVVLDIGSERIGLCADVALHRFPWVPNEVSTSLNGKQSARANVGASQHHDLVPSSGYVCTCEISREQTHMSSERAWNAIMNPGDSGRAGSRVVVGSGHRSLWAYWSSTRLLRGNECDKASSKDSASNVICSAETDLDRR